MLRPRSQTQTSPVHPSVSRRREGYLAGARSSGVRGWGGIPTGGRYLFRGHRARNGPLLPGTVVNKRKEIRWTGGEIMTMERPTAHVCPARVERRRSKRFPVVVPAEVKWHGPDGASLKEKAKADEVNSQGGLLRMEAYPPVGDIIELTNLLSAESAQARVLAMRRSNEDVVRGVAVELLVPSETFWGVNFQLKKNTAELLKLEQALQSGGIELGNLREFRGAVDQLRRTAWALEEWEERHQERRSSETVLSLLTAERIRRATHLCKELATELEACAVNFGTKGIPEFYRAIDRVYQLLERSCTYLEPR